jgi:hypothetical protein
MQTYSWELASVLSVSWLFWQHVTLLRCWRAEGEGENDHERFGFGCA